MEHPNKKCSLCNDPLIAGFDTRPTGEDGEMEDWPLCAKCLEEKKNEPEIDPVDAQVLAVAMIQRAARDIHGIDVGSTTEDVTADALNWVNQENTRGGSFGWCCALLEQEMDVIRPILLDRNRADHLLQSKIRRAVLR
jgi:hypothetical protein